MPLPSHDSEQLPGLFLGVPFQLSPQSSTCRNFRGFTEGFLDGATQKPYHEGLIVWQCDLEPPFIPVGGPNFESGYRRGYADGRQSRN